MFKFYLYLYFAIQPIYFINLAAMFYNKPPIYLSIFLDPPEKSIDETSIQDFKNLLDLNLVNYFTLCKVSRYINQL